MLTAAGSDDLGGQGLRDELLLEAEQRLQAARLLRILIQPDLLQAKMFDLLFQFIIFLAHSPQVKVVAPQIADAALKAHDTFFKRSNCIHYPDTDQTAGFVLAGALDLDCKSEDLGKQNRHQDGDVAVAADQVFHGLIPSSSFSF